MTVAVIPGGGNYLELAGSGRGTRFIKHALSVGPLRHPATGKMLQITPAHLQQIADNYHRGSTGPVPVVLADDHNRHSDDPMRGAGAVTDVWVENGKLFTELDIRRPDVAEGIRNGTILGSSGLISLGFKGRHDADGGQPSAALLHQCLTSRPFIADLAPFEEVAATAGLEDDLVMLTALEFAGNDGDDDDDDEEEYADEEPDEDEYDYGDDDDRALDQYDRNQTDYGAHHPGNVHKIGHGQHEHSHSHPDLGIDQHRHLHEHEGGHSGYEHLTHDHDPGMRVPGDVTPPDEMPGQPEEPKSKPVKASATEDPVTVFATSDGRQFSADELVSAIAELTERASDGGLVLDHLGGLAQQPEPEGFSAVTLEECQQAAMELGVPWEAVEDHACELAGDTARASRP